MVTVSIATSGDIDGIIKIYHQTGILHYEKLPHIFKKPCMEDEKELVTTYFKNKDVTIFKAEDNDIICGYLVLRIKQLPEKFFVSTRKGFIDSIGVDENHRRHGIGQQLIKAAEDYLKQQDIYTMEIEVYMFNNSAMTFYEKMGYETLVLSKNKEF